MTFHRRIENLVGYFVICKNPKHLPVETRKKNIQRYVYINRKYSECFNDDDTTDEE